MPLTTSFDFTSPISFVGVSTVTVRSEGAVRGRGGMISEVEGEATGSLPRIDLGLLSRMRNDVAVEPAFTGDVDVRCGGERASL